METKNLVEIGSLVVDEAIRRMTECGAPGDQVRIRATESGNALFQMGRERIIWSPGVGWKADVATCSDEFLKDWRDLYGNDNRIELAEETFDHPMREGA